AARLLVVRGLVGLGLVVGLRLRLVLVEQVLVARQQRAPLGHRERAVRRRDVVELARRRVVLRRVGRLDARRVRADLGLALLEDLRLVGVLVQRLGVAVVDAGVLVEGLHRQDVAGLV